MARYKRIAREDLVKALLAAARAAVDARGLQALNARALAEAAGCSVGMIYQAYPGGLDELVRALNPHSQMTPVAAVRTRPQPRQYLRSLALPSVASRCPVRWRAGRRRPCARGRRPDRAPRSPRGLPAGGRDGGAARRVRRDPSPDRLETLAVERSRVERGRVTRNDLLREAVLGLLEEEGV
jgi:AcrR family transcriptional regulator